MTDDVIGDAAAESDLEITAGAPWSYQVTIAQSGYDFTGHTGQWTIRKGLDAASTVVQVITCATPTTATTGTLVFTASLTAAQTKALATYAAGRTGERRISIGYHDLELVAGGLVVGRESQGEAFLSRRANNS